MDYDKKKFFKFIGFFVGIALVIILFVVFDLSGESNNKLFKQFDYVYDNKTTYVSDYISGIPRINVLSDEVDDVNSKIMSNYYDVVTRNYSGYSYKYCVINNLLSLVIETNIYDDSEYGSIRYYGYYVDLDTGKVLSGDDFLDRIGVSFDSVNSALNKRYMEFYSNDSLRWSMGFDDYYSLIDSDSDIVYFVRDNNLYLYKVINYTHDIIENDGYGNIYKFYVLKLGA